MLVYDIALTFSDEVDCIWSRKKYTKVTALWVLNRYLWPLAYIVVLVSFHDPNWSEHACQNYIYFPQIIRLVVSTSVGVYFIIRLYAVSFRNRTILAVAVFLLSAQIAVKIWAILDITSLPLPPGFAGCFLTSRSPPNHRFMWTYLSEVIYDFLMMTGTCVIICKHHLNNLFLSAIMKDSVMYLVIITASNTCNIVLFVFAPPYLKNTMTGFSALLTSVIASRMMLSIAKINNDPRIFEPTGTSSAMFFKRRTILTIDTFHAKSVKTEGTEYTTSSGGFIGSISSIASPDTPSSAGSDVTLVDSAEYGSALFYSPTSTEPDLENGCS